MIRLSEPASCYRLMARVVGLTLTWLVRRRRSTLNAGDLLPEDVVLIQLIRHAAADVSHNSRLLKYQHFITSYNILIMFVESFAIRARAVFDVGRHSSVVSVPRQVRGRCHFARRSRANRSRADGYVACVIIGRR